MKKKLYISAAGMVMLISAYGDTLSGFNTVTYDNTVPTNQFLTSVTYESVTYQTNEFTYGTTDRYYNLTAGGTAIWVEGDDFPADGTEVSGTSNAKKWDLGSDADNNLWSVPATEIENQVPDMASIDGLPFLQTVFDFPVTDIFLFERGTGDSGTVVPVLSQDGLTLGSTPLTLTYSTIDGIEVGNPGSSNLQGVEGCVYHADTPIWGIRVIASGLDALTIMTVNTPPLPEIGTLSIEAGENSASTVLTWTNTVSFGNYHVLQTSDLISGNWSTSAPIPGVDGTMSVTNFTTEPASFYSVYGEK